MRERRLPKPLQHGRGDLRPLTLRTGRQDTTPGPASASLPLNQRSFGSEPQAQGHAGSVYSVNAQQFRHAHSPSSPAGASWSTGAHRLGRFTTTPSWLLRAITTTASSAPGFSSRCGTYGGTKM